MNLERPASVPTPVGMSLPRPPSPYLQTRHGSQQLSKEDTSKFVPLQQMADLKKSNFSLKLKIYYLETTLSKVSGVEQFDVLNENVQLKVEKEGLIKELSTNKELLIKASSVVDTLSSKQTNHEEEGRLSEENDELRKMLYNLENELLTARQESEEKSMELEQVHADCMLLEDQVLIKDEALTELREVPAEPVISEDFETLQAQLAAQEHLYQTDVDDLKGELEEVREVMIRTHEENIGHRLTLAEKDDMIRELKDQLLSGERTDESSDAGESRASLMEALSTYTATNARLEEELDSMENTNTELKNVINTLNNDRENLLEQLTDREDLQLKLRDYESEFENLRQELHELRLADSPAQRAEVDDLTAELSSAREEVEELKHTLTQSKISHDITVHEAAILRGTIEETEQLKQEEEQIVKNLRQNVERLSKENAECSSENTTIQGENEMLREKVQDLNREMHDLKEEARNLRKASDTANDPKLNELNEEILSLKQCLADANEELNYCKEEMRTLESELERTSEELELAEEDLKEGERRRLKLTDDLDEMREELLKLKSQANEDKTRWRHERSKTDQELTEYRNQVSGLLHDQERLEGEKKRFIGEKENADRALKQTATDKGKALFEAKKLEADMDKLKKDLNSLKKKNERLEDEMRAYENREVEEKAEAAEDLAALSAQKSYMDERIKELQDTKRSLEDSVLSLKDQLSSSPLPGSLYDNVIYENIDDIDPCTGEDEKLLKDKIIRDLKADRDHHRDERKDLEKELRKIHELVHSLIRQLHRFNSANHGTDIALAKTEDFLVDSLQDAITLVLGNLIRDARDRQISNTSSGQSTSGIVSGSENTLHMPEDLAALQRENSLLHTDLLESRDLISALRREMKTLLEKLNSTSTGDTHVRNMLTQINDLIHTSLVQSPEKVNHYSAANGAPPHEYSNNTHEYSNNTHEYSNNTHEYSNITEVSSSPGIDAEHRLTLQRLKMREARLGEMEAKLKQSNQELSSSECKLTSTQSKLAVAEHKIQGLEQDLHRKDTQILKKDSQIKRSESQSRSATCRCDHSSTILLNQKIDSLQVQLQNTEELLGEKMKLIRDKNEVIDSLIDEKRSRSKCDSERSRSRHEMENTETTLNVSYRSPYSPRTSSPLNLTPTTIQVSDYILLCASNWLDELPELMRALRDAVRSSLVDCQSVQTRVTERKAVWAMAEVARLSTRLDAVFRLLQHVENLSVQQPPARLVHSLQQEVTSKDNEIHSLNDKLVKRSKDIQKLRNRIDEQDRMRLKQKLHKNNLAGLNPSILSKVIDTETVLREAHKSLEKRMVSKESRFS